MNQILKILFFLSLVFMQSCLDQKKKESKFKNTVKMDSKNLLFENIESFKLLDSIYPNKNYKISLTSIQDSILQNYDYTTKTHIFVINQNDKVIMLDSVHSDFGSIKYEDFNNDNIKDMLVENISDVRSNLTFHLYLVDTINDKFTKVKGFNRIKNPHYLPKYNLIDNLVMSGKNWTSFYQIQKDSLIEFEYILYSLPYDNDGYIEEFNKQYNETINKILKHKKYLE